MSPKEKMNPFRGGRSRHGSLSRGPHGKPLKGRHSKKTEVHGISDTVPPPRPPRPPKQVKIILKNGKIITPAE